MAASAARTFSRFVAVTIIGSSSCATAAGATQATPIASGNSKRNIIKLIPAQNERRRLEQNVSALFYLLAGGDADGMVRFAKRLLLQGHQANRRAQRANRPRLEPLPLR